ncbi:MAG: DUF481 domain-containing protein [Acidobacteria bacterium]|nr:DUF481 domain-containing protein [Acidobacteriota bacterium]
MTAAPQAASGAPRRLRVYLDCDSCFSEYLRSEIDWVDFVRQPQDADVHLLASSRETGSGGREYVLRFVGAGRFQGNDKDLRAVSMTGDPEELRRTGVLGAVTVGFLSYMAIDGLPPGWELSMKSKSAEPDDAPPAGDPWNLWVFRLSGGGSFEAQETTRQTEWRGSASADRVTDAWKISFGASIEESTERFDLDEDAPLKVSRGNRELEGFVAKSLGPHWSLGLGGRVNASEFGNTRLSTTLTPAVEYSVFPYREYASRQLLVKYQLGLQRASYKEITLFDKLRETLWQHELSADFDQKQPWGSVEFGLEWRQYLHDLSKYRLEAQADVSFRITRGLSVTAEAQASRIRDQISLPRRDATSEEVLLRLRELQSGYEVQFSFGITYSFGSLFNNVVNPRFGG